MDMDERKEQLLTKNAERLAVAIETEYKPGMTLEALRTFLKSKGFGVETNERAIAIWFRDFSTRPEEPKKEEKKEPIGGKHHLFKFTDIPNDYLYSDYIKACLKTTNPFMQYANVDLARDESRTTFTVHYIPGNYIKTKAKILGMQKDQRVLFLDMPKALEEKFGNLGTLKKLDDFVDLYTLRVYVWNNVDDAITCIKEAEVPEKRKEKINGFGGCQVILDEYFTIFGTGDVKKSEEPKMKRHLAIYEISPVSKYIYFDADEETANFLKKYGYVAQWTDMKARHRLAVDGRFNFEEVIKHVHELEKEIDIPEPTVRHWVAQSDSRG